MISNALLKGVEPGERCVRRQFRYASCDACVRVCPTQALSCADGKLVVDNDHCVKCAACLFVCPVEAIEGVETEKRFFRDHILVAPFSVIAPTVEELLFGMWKIISAESKWIRSAIRNGCWQSPGLIFDFGNMVSLSGHFHDPHKAKLTLPDAHFFMWGLKRRHLPEFSQAYVAGGNCGPG